MCGSAAVFDTYGLGAGQYMVYGCLVTGGIDALEWFHTSTVMWTFLLWPGRLGGMWSVIRVDRDEPPWG